MTYFLGIDGGGTGCRAALADASGAILAMSEAGPANISSDWSGARENILSSARAAVAAAFGGDRVEAVLPMLHAGLGLAGANAAGAAKHLMGELPFRSTRIETDAVTATLGALGGADGIVAAIGTGSVFASVRGGVFRQVGGWGLVLGDEGSAAWLGRALLSETLRATDGLRPDTPLLCDVRQDFGGPAGIVTFAQGARPADLAALAPRLTGRDDPAARVILDAGAAHVAAFIGLLQEPAPLPVVFAGGLGAFYRDLFAGRTPWDIRPSSGTALDGALLLARKAA